MKTLLFYLLAVMNACAAESFRNLQRGSRWLVIGTDGPGVLYGCMELECTVVPNTGGGQFHMGWETCGPRWTSLEAPPFLHQLARNIVTWADQSN